MNVNLGGILGLLAGLGLGLLLTLPVDSANPDGYGRAGKLIAIGIVAGAFAGNLACAHFFKKDKRKVN